MATEDLESKKDSEGSQGEYGLGIAYFFCQDLIYLLLEREEGGERERGRNSNV